MILTVTLTLTFLRPHRLPIWTAEIFAEELYDHRNDTSSDLGHKEVINLANDTNFKEILEEHRNKFRNYLQQEIVYLNISTTFNKLLKKKTLVDHLRGYIDAIL
jgi:hypothetical protein